MTHAIRPATLLLPLVVASPLAAAQGTEVASARIEVRGHYDNAVGSSDAASQGVVRAELLKSRPALRPGEVLEFVPGLIVTQHSGDGKANQYFLRGFNLDHGTDFATSVNGVPVNMPTHAHGQGYSDLNFLIPELIARITFRKGPYAAEDGDFASAGSRSLSHGCSASRSSSSTAHRTRNSCTNRVSTPIVCLRAGISVPCRDDSASAGTRSIRTSRA